MKGKLCWSWGLILLNIFINILSHGLRCTLLALTGDTKLVRERGSRCAVGHGCHWGDLDKLEERGKIQEKQMQSLAPDCCLQLPTRGIKKKMKPSSSQRSTAKGQESTVTGCSRRNSTEYKGKSFAVRMVEPWSRSCRSGVPVLGDFQNFLLRGHEQQIQCEKLASCWAGGCSDDLHRSSPAYVILWWLCSSAYYLALASQFRCSS